MNADENKPSATLRPLDYWRLWLLDTVLVSAGFLFFLATHYGTYDFFGRACGMALLPLIPVLVLVGGGGSTVFALTKVWIEKRSLKKPTALALLAGPGLALTLALVLLGAGRMSGHRFSYICLGNAPVTATHVQVTGYSTFLREEWLAVFKVEKADFQKLVAGAKLESVPEYEFNAALAHSSLKVTGVFQSIPRTGHPACFRWVFKESQEHQLGRVYAMFDTTSSTAVVFREYND